MEFYAVVGQVNVNARGVINYDDYFVADMGGDRQIGTLKDAEDTKRELDKLYGMDYSWRVVKLSFLN